METTSILGPNLKSTKSPKTGGKLITLALNDKSFEFHVKVDQIDMVSFVEVQKPDPTGNTKTLRICRFLSDEGTTLCSLILMDSTKDGIEWFADMMSRYSM